MQESVIREDTTHGNGEPADAKVILLSTISEIKKYLKLLLQMWIMFREHEKLFVICVPILCDNCLISIALVV